MIMVSMKNEKIIARRLLNEKRAIDDHINELFYYSAMISVMPE